MPIRRKQQILAALQTSEGVAASLGASNAVLVYEPEIQDELQIQDRVPAGPTLSRDFVPIGRKTRTITFQSDFRGSGDTSIPITVPEWGTLVSACAFKEITPVTLPITAPSGTGFQVGEIVQKSSTIRGLVIACFASGTTLTHRMSVAGDVVVVPIQGTFTTGGTLTGESSATTGTIGTVAGYPGLAYQPTSEKLLHVTTGAWAPGVSGLGAGSVLQVRAGGIVAGGVQIIEDISAGSFDDMNVTLLWGTIANTNTLHFGANSATIDTEPAMIRTPALTLRHNLDGRQRDLVTARGDFQMQGEAGGPMIFSWTFTGDPGPNTDALPLVTTGLSAIRPPRMFGAIAAFGLAADAAVPPVSPTQLHRLPVKSIGFQPGNNIAPNLDVNSAGGATGSNVGDRDPQITVQVDQVHSAFDFEAARDNSTAIRFAMLAGTTKGNIVGLVAPYCQLTEIGSGDADGVAVFDLTLRPRRVLESGDDEMALFQV